MEPLSRITPATIDVLKVLDHATDPCWGLLVIKSSGRPPGSVYPILERLERAGWVSSSWEADASRPGPRRRYYELTEGGVTAARAAMATFAARQRPAAATRLAPAKFAPAALAPAALGITRLAPASRSSRSSRSNRAAVTAVTAVTVVTA